MLARVRLSTHVSYAGNSKGGSQIPFPQVGSFQVCLRTPSAQMKNGLRSPGTSETALLAKSFTVNTCRIESTTCAVEARGG
eukprot:7473770-Pyramimonas_sp.AAC.1